MEATNIVQYYTINVTPEMATQWLKEYNKNNRPIRRYRVLEMARDMRDGLFLRNGDSIKFDKNGRLIDGQHRLSACVESGCVLRDQLVIVGLDPECIDTIDSGAKRTAADKLKMNGVKNSVVVSTAAKILVHYMAGDLSFCAHISSPQRVLAEAKMPRYPLQEATSLAARIWDALGGSKGLYCAVLSICLHYDKAKTKDFVQGVATGEGLKKGDPALTYRNYLIRNMQAKRGRRSASWAFQGQILIKAINAFFSGKKLSVLKWAEDEKMQDLFFCKVLRDDTKPEVEREREASAKKAVPAPLAEFLQAAKAEKKTA